MVVAALAVPEADPDGRDLAVGGLRAGGNARPAQELQRLMHKRKFTTEIYHLHLHHLLDH